MIRRLLLTLLVLVGVGVVYLGGVGLFSLVDVKPGLEWALGLFIFPAGFFVSFMLEGVYLLLRDWWGWVRGDV